jgi:hypothetical protein
VIDRLGQVGVDVAPASAAQLGEFLKSEIAKWDKIVKKSNITAE